MAQGPILVVDDEPHNLEAVRQVLAGEYRLVFARSGEAALAAVAKHRPALVLLDIQMPDLDGYEVCRRLKADPQSEQVPVIFVTSLAGDWNEQLGFECGGVDYVTKPLSPMVLRARVRTHLSLVRACALERSYRDAIAMLGEAGHFHDTDTGSHIWRMAATARHLAELAGWDEERCAMLELAAPMHDMGKIGVPESILRKPGPLDADEWVVMKAHSRIGHRILSASQAPLFRMAAEIALNHHERWDGSGYPAGLSGEAIPECARIVAVADVFDALTMRRSYKEPWPREKVLDYFSASAGSHFEPRLVALFLQHFDAFEQIRQHWLAVPAR